MDKTFFFTKIKTIFEDPESISMDMPIADNIHFLILFKIWADKVLGITFTLIRRFYPKRITVHSGYTFFFYQYVCSLGIEPTTFCVANAMLYHWATVIINQLFTGKEIKPFSQLQKQFSIPSNYMYTSIYDIALQVTNKKD